MINFRKIMSTALFCFFAILVLSCGPKANPPQASLSDLQGSWGTYYCLYAARGDYEYSSKDTVKIVGNTYEWTHVLYDYNNGVCPAGNGKLAKVVANVDTTPPLMSVVEKGTLTIGATREDFKCSLNPLAGTCLAQELNFTMTSLSLTPLDTDAGLPQATATCANSGTFEVGTAKEIGADADCAKMFQVPPFNLTKYRGIYWFFGDPADTDKNKVTLDGSTAELRPKLINMPNRYTKL